MSTQCDRRTTRRSSLSDNSDVMMRTVPRLPALSLERRVRKQWKVSGMLN